MKIIQVDAIDGESIARCYGRGKTEEEAKLNCIVMVAERCLKKIKDYESGHSSILHRHIFKDYKYKTIKGVKVEEPKEEEPIQLELPFPEQSQLNS